MTNKEKIRSSATIDTGMYVYRFVCVCVCVCVCVFLVLHIRICPLSLSLSLCIHTHNTGYIHLYTHSLSHKYKQTFNTQGRSTYCTLQSGLESYDMHVSFDMQCILLLIYTGAKHLLHLTTWFGVSLSDPTQAYNELQDDNASSSATLPIILVPAPLHQDGLELISPPHASSVTAMEEIHVSLEEKKSLSPSCIQRHGHGRNPRKPRGKKKSLPLMHPAQSRPWKKST
jgi:hypothetical protein